MSRYAEIREALDDLDAALDALDQAGNEKTSTETDARAHIRKTARLRAASAAAHVSAQDAIRRYFPNLVARPEGAR